MKGYMDSRLKYISISLSIMFFLTILSGVNGKITTINQTNDTLQLSNAAIKLPEPISIDAANKKAGAKNWDWAATQDWCSGSGTLKDPYVIENVIIDAKYSQNAINITDSNEVYFEIRNCTLLNAHANGGFFAGIYIRNSSKGEIYDNIFRGGYYGVNIRWYSHDIRVRDNYFENHTYSSAACAIYVYYYCTDIHILNNIITYSNYSCYLYNHATDCIVANNICSNSTHASLKFTSSSENNEIYGNVVFDSQDEGIYLTSADNLIYGNCFANNALNGRPFAGSWNTSQYGNWWDDYYGSSSNGIIGDTPYNIWTTYFDYKPLMNFAPVITQRPNDMTYVEGTKTPTLTWQVIDFSTLQATYEVYRNGQLILSGENWISQDEIEFTTSDLPAGSYTYQIVCDDGISLSVSDSVTVTATGTEDLFGSVLEVLNDYSFLIGSAAILVGLVVNGVLKRTRTPETTYERSSKKKKSKRD